MSWLLFGLSVWGLLFTLNARWPSKTRAGLAPSFFAAWLTIELAPFHLLIQLVVTVVLVAGGALEAWPGWVGLGLCVVSWAGLVVMVAQGGATRRVIDAALGDEILGDVAAAPSVPTSKLLLPFAFGRRGARKTRNIVFGSEGGRSQKLDVIAPRDSRPGERRPALVHIHGGGWVIGDKREQGFPLMWHMAANGWVCFTINYRLSPFATWPEHLIDCKRAIAFIREHADEYGIDPDFLCVTGGSAGGHLTALVGLTANDPRYQPGFEDADTSVAAAVPFYGVYDFTNRQGTMLDGFLPMFIEPWVMKKRLADDPDAFSSASPIDVVNASAPPFFVLHGDHDTLAPVEDARLFVERLRAVSGQPVHYAEFAGAEHAFEIFYSLRAKACVERVERFLTWAHTRHESGDGHVRPASQAVSSQAR